MAKTRIDYYHHRMIVIKTVLLLLIIGETNSDVNLFDIHGFDRPLFPAWYKQPPIRVNLKPTDDWNDRIYFMKEDVVRLPACQNEDYCEDSSNYPEEFVRTKLKEAKGISAVRDILPNRTDDDLSVRIDMDEIQMCASREKLILPTSAKSMNGEWLFIAQNGQEFAQAVRIETCLKDSEPCRFVSPKHKAVCEQKYIYRKLVAVKDESLETDIFRFPASCCCAIKNV